MQNRQLKRYVLDEDMYLDDSDGLYIFDQQYCLENVFEIVNNELKIKEHIKEEFGLHDEDGLRAIIFTAFSTIIWEEEYVIDDCGIEYTIFIGKDIDEEDYYALKVRTGLKHESNDDGNGGTIDYKVYEPFIQIIKQYKNDLSANEESLFKRLQCLQDNIRENIIKFKDKPKFRKPIDV